MLSKQDREYVAADLARALLEALPFAFDGRNRPVMPQAVEIYLSRLTDTYGAPKPHKCALVLRQALSMFCGHLISELYRRSGDGAWLSIDADELAATIEYTRVDEKGRVRPALLRLKQWPPSALIAPARKAALHE